MEITPGLKKIAYNFIDDLVEKLRLIVDETYQKNRAVASEAMTRITALQQVRNRPLTDPEVQNRVQAAQIFLNRKDLGKFISQDALQQTQNTTNNSGRFNWELNRQRQSSDYSIKEVPGSESDPGVIVLSRLNLQGELPTVKKVQQQMGDWMKIVRRSDYGFDTYVRRTKEAWQKFKSLAPLWLDDTNTLSEINDRKLPSESQFGGSVPPEEKTQNRSIQVTLVNFGTPESITDWEHKGKDKVDGKKGIRITFAPDDDFFFSVVNFATKDLQLGARVGPGRRTIDIFDLNPDKLVQLSKQMQGWKYGVVDLNKAIATATGKSVGIIQEKRTHKEKSAKLSPTVIFNGIAKNTQGYQLPPRDQFGAEIEQKYPAAFDRNVASDQQIEAQKDGVYFILGRQASVLADEPGAGKTLQSQMAADIATEPGQKILVLTPSILIAENWTNPKQGPARFLGHTQEMVRPVQSPDEFDQAVGDPNVRWIVIPYSSFANRSDEWTMADRIKKAANAKVFGALLMDEFQQIKSLTSDTFKAIAKAVDASGIPHRVGMTGTPADNDPSDLYTQLRLLRHPLLFAQDGKGQYSLRQTEKGFANQFLGGEGVHDDSLSTILKIDSIFGWAKRLSDEEKESILQLFATTYIRREKADMRPDLPPKHRHAIPVGTPEEQQYWNDHEAEMREEMAKTKSNKYSTFLKKLAMAKAPYTIQRAVQYLSENPNEKLFVVTKHPEVALHIEKAINEQLGDGTAGAVVGGSDGDKTEKRMLVPEAFKNPNGILPGKQFPLRCAIYTMRLGSVGLNFGNAGKAIFNDMDWNPSTNLQAEDRVHRITNTRPADIEYTYFQGTYEENQWMRVQKKQALNKATMDIMRHAYNLPPEQLLDLANKFVLNLVDSLLMKMPMTPQQEAYVEQKKQAFLANASQANQIPQEVAAKSWYGRFKSASLQYRHLW